MAVIKIEANFDHLREIVAVGVRRATVFMGIGSNAVLVDPPISHVLYDRVMFQSVPIDVDDVVKIEFLLEFESWIITNAFRDLAETFSLFLTAVNTLYHGLARGLMTAGELQKIEKTFSFAGLSDQFAKLTPLLGIEPHFAKMFASINQARNCMAHRRGIVGPQDITVPGEAFVFQWRTIAVKLDDGTDISARLNAGHDPVMVEANQSVLVGPVDRSKSFLFGDSIKFTRHELNEICFGVTMAMEHIRSKLIEFARSKGHVINEIQPGPPPAEISALPEDVLRATIDPSTRQDEP